MRIETAGEPGDPQRPNEDYASVVLPASGAGGAVVVLDGVTPPAGDDGCVHGVPWYTARLGGALLELSGSRRDMTLPQCLSEAIARTAEAHSSICDLSHPRTPQATVSTVRWDEETVEHLVLSDASLLLEAGDGTVTPVLDTRLDRLPEEVHALRRRVRSLPSGSADRSAAAATYVEAVEAQRNAPGGNGFYTAAADPDVAALAVTGTTPRRDVRALLAMTDGASRWRDLFGFGDWGDLLALARREGVQTLIDRVRAAESADPAGTAFARFKRHDDATAVLVEW
jgi:hypothetical protein